MHIAALVMLVGGLLVGYRSDVPQRPDSVMNLLFPYIGRRLAHVRPTRIQRTGKEAADKLARVSGMRKLPGY